MQRRILIVEDESLVALELEATLDELGHQVIGIAPDSATAFRLVDKAPDIALVDLNLRDGPTGILVGARLSQEFGVNVLFMTANPKSLGAGVPGATGVLPKPYSAEDVQIAMEYLTGKVLTPPPLLKVFQQAVSA
jgi:two-component system, response regulator PdtaR